MISKLTESILNGSVGFEEEPWTPTRGYEDDPDREWDEPNQFGLRPAPTEAQRKRAHNRDMIALQEAGLGHEGRRLACRAPAVSDQFATNDPVAPTPEASGSGEVAPSGVDLPPVARVIIP